MNLIYKLFLITSIVYKECFSYVVIKRFDDIDCKLHINSTVRNEIKTYENIVKIIMDKVKTESGPEMYQNYTQFIDKFGPRLSGSSSLENAIDYMMHLTVINGIYTAFTEKVVVPHWTRGSEEAKMLSPRSKRIAILGLGTSVPTPVEGITTEVIVVKTFEELDSLDYSYVVGKIVVFNPIFVSYSETGQYRSQGASRAAMKGAVASLIKSVTPFSLYTPHAGIQAYADNVTKIPTASITVEDANLFQRFYESGEKIVLHIKMESTLDYKNSRNTLIDLKGSERQNEMVIVSGHMDSWDVGEGALDNGGGMFISWFVPIVLKRLDMKPRRTIRAALWTAEEFGLVGSAAYLRKHQHELDKINFILESDIGTFKPQGLEVGGTVLTRCIIAEILKLFSPIDKMKYSKAPGSDMSQFIKAGVPGASLMNENDRYFYYYHSDADTMDVQNRTDVINCAAFWAAVSYVIADLSVNMQRNAIVKV